MQNNYISHDYFKKVALIGDSNSGKTSFFERFIHNKFEANKVVTLYADFLIKQLQIKDGLCKLQVRDTAGQERYQAIAKMYYLGVNGIMIVYDITNRESFKSASSHLLQIQKLIGTIAPQDQIQSIEYMLVGSKIDLKSRQVSPDEGQQFANDNNMSFIEVSSLSGENVELAFQTLAEKMVQNKLNADLKSSATKNLIPPHQDKDQRCI